MYLRTLRSFSRSTIDSSRRSPSPVVRMQARLAVRSGRFSMNHSMRRLNDGMRSSSSESSVSTANSGISPTMERTFMGKRSPVGGMQHVVEEAVLLVPHALAVVPAIAHGVGDVEEVLPELAGDVFVGRIFFRQFERDGQQVQRVHRHPTGAVGLLEMAAGGQRRAAVEDANVVEAEEAALEDVHAFGVFAVHPPGEVQQQLVEDALQKCSRSPRPRCFLSIL